MRSNPQLQFGKATKAKNFAIPAIPSRFLTPILKFDMNEKDEQSLAGQYEVLDGSMESILVSKVARLTNDGRTLGPGAYNVDAASKALASSPKGGVKWSNSRSQREDYFTKTHNQRDVGPGAYQPKKTINRSINNPTIPRADRQASSLGFKKQLRRKTQSPADFEMMDEEEEAYVSPGPGNYLQPFHTTTFGKNSILHEYPQNFGSTVRRFREQPIGCILGPG